MKVQFNKAVVATLPIGTHQDTKQRGLVLNVTAHSRRFGVYLSIRNVPTRKAIGPIEDWSVEAARLEAAKIIADLKSTPKQKEQKMTLEALAGLFTTHLETMGRKTSGYMNDSIRLNWSHLKHRLVNEITSVEIAEAHSKIVKARGPGAGRRAVSSLRTLYHFANSLEITERNPAKKVRMIPEKSREVFLTEPEIVVLVRVLNTMPQDAHDYFKLVLLTGARRSNVAGMQKTWLDLDQGVCVVPPEYSKNGEALTLALVPEAVEILERRMAGDSPYVFPSDKAAGGHLTEPWFWLQEIREKCAELGMDKHFTIHDLRRTAATRLSASGASLPVVAKFLGHKNVLTTPVYARADASMVREALLKIAG